MDTVVSFTCTYADAGKPSRSRKLVLTSLSNTSPLTSNSCLSVQGSEAVLGAFLVLSLLFLKAPLPLGSESSRSLKKRGRGRCESPKGTCSSSRCPEKTFGRQGREGDPSCPYCQENTCGDLLSETPPLQAFFSSLT